ncbi:MAG: CDP-alcohol phosphatidyltransferase family protein [Ignavibacteria bacterium]|nr:CDP-alcohol phosphatidyltransferase family protein [Ignavibacteria bacterium]
MTIPNILSLTRLILGFVIGFFLISNQKTLAIILIFIAWITDLLDGFLARKLNSISELGKILDPIADKILILIIVISLLINKTISPVTGMFVVFRDLIILSAGFFAAKKFNFVIPSNIIGKISAFLIGTILFVLLFSPNLKLKYFLEILICIISVVSLFLYSFYYFNWWKRLKSS